MSTYDPTDLRGQELSEAEKQAKERIARELEEKDWKWLMGRPQGRRIVWRLLEQSRVFQLSFNTNAMSMAFNEGNRNYGNTVLAKILALCPELFQAMLKENSSNGRNSDGDGHKSN